MRRALASFALFSALWAAPAAAEAPKVVVSIKPIHALVAAVMQGVGEPTVLVRGGASPHDYALKPSDAKALKDADIVFWVGGSLESFLERPIASLPKKTQEIELMYGAGIQVLEPREGGAWEAHAHGRTHDHGKHQGHHGEMNPHLWLDPMNAKEIGEIAAVALAARDKANAETYKANAAALGRRLDALDAELKAALAPVADKRFVVFHDAYQYFENRYNLNAAGSITVSPDRPPSAKRLSVIRDRVKALGATCVFAEPEFEPKLVRTVTEGTQARTGVLDPEGAALPEGPELYFTLMRNLAKGLTECLGG
ncbi:zinc ABC transporter substrate-binding protein [Azospirillum sp.]|uniref:zinc ABC transporter substrate-binding protein n=1 Tax=Azospirillum sp. TaxID=34012 RepID=UPI003D752818